MRIGALLTALALLATAPSAGAQPSEKIARLGVLVFSNIDPNTPALQRGLRELGYVDGKNIAIEYRSAEGKIERVPGLVADLVGLKPDVIFALGGEWPPFVKRATSTIPIVMVVSADPVQSGLIASLARPGGNLTGVTLASSELAARRLQLLKEVAPAVSRVGVLWNPEHPDFEYEETLVAARALRVQVQSLEARGPDDLEVAFRAAVAAGAQAVVVASSRLMNVNRVRIVDLAAKNRLLLVSSSGWAEAGGLLGYGPDIDAVVRRGATYVDKILKGAKPGDLPVQRPTRFELTVNTKTAKAFGLTIPQSIRVQADKVIE